MKFNSMHNDYRLISIIESFDKIEKVLVSDNFRVNVGDSSYLASENTAYSIDSDNCKIADEIIFSDELMKKISRYNLRSRNSRLRKDNKKLEEKLTKMENQIKLYSIKLKECTAMYNRFLEFLNKVEKTDIFNEFLESEISDKI